MIGEAPDRWTANKAKAFDIAVGAIRRRMRLLRDEKIELVHLNNALVRSQGLDNRVHFLGQRTDVAELHTSADVAAHASRKAEPFGLVVVEALAVGTPVIASNQGGPREVINESCGFMHDSNDPSELTDHFNLLVSRAAELILQLREGACTRAWEFDVSRTVARMQDIYRELI